MTLANPLTDVRLREAVIRQLEWDPAVDANALEVAAGGGLVTLGGTIETYPAKLAAEKAAKRVSGVSGVINNIEVRLAVDRTDEDVALDAAEALRLHSTVPHDVRADVQDGRVTLHGRVDWPFQKRSADRAVREIRGVQAIVNAIEVAPRAVARDLEHRIVRTLHHNADVDAHRIKVSVFGDRATLKGTVSTWLQREAAERAVGDAPGITRVDNQLTVESPREIAEQDELC